MINIQKLIEEANENGYHGDKAYAKVCQDIVLKALSIGPLSRNVTIKGGVVMRARPIMLEELRRIWTLILLSIPWQMSR